MKFALFFLSLFIYVLTLLKNSGVLGRFILVWLLINLGLMIVAYMMNKPVLILGKTSGGKVSLFLMICNFPWLALTWIVFRLQVICSRENFVHTIPGTNLSLGRHPLKGDPINKFAFIIDLTAEFPKYKTTANYLAIPNLDGHYLKEFGHLEQIPTDKPVLIHCANGHGRTALFASILLIERGIARTPEEALTLIQSARPLAKPNRSQHRWIKNHFIQNKDITK